jgi:predicted RNA binding protein YcfA (HicA-like mRNA interferase family)
MAPEIARKRPAAQVAFEQPLRVGCPPEVRREMKSSNVLKQLAANGWLHVRTRGSHHIYTDPKTGRIAVVPHPKRDLPIGTVKALERQTGIKFQK